MQFDYQAYHVFRIRPTEDGFETQHFEPTSAAGEASLRAKLGRIKSGAVCVELSQPGPAERNPKMHGGNDDR